MHGRTGCQDEKNKVRSDGTDKMNVLLYADKAIIMSESGPA